MKALDLFLITCCLWGLLSLTGASEEEQALMKKLLANYNTKVRPAQRPGEKVVVRIGMMLSSFNGLNMKAEEMSTYVFMNLEWTDYRLVWNPAEHSGIHEIRIPPANVWLPDIVLVNNNDGVFYVSLQVRVQVHSDGRVTWLPPALYRSSCKVQTKKFKYIAVYLDCDTVYTSSVSPDGSLWIDVTYFPFDWQNCTMVFHSITYDSTEVELHHALDERGREIREIVYDTSFSESGEWIIRHQPSRKNVYRPDNYEDITFYLIIERRPMYYVFNIIIPCILITIIAIANFYLPPDAGEKMGLSINVLLTLTVFLLLLADKIPETSLGVPIIVNYLVFTMVLVTCSVILSVVVLNLHHRTPSTHDMPMWIRRIFIHMLPPYLGLLRPKVETPLSLVKPHKKQAPLAVSRAMDEYFIRKPSNSVLFPKPNRYQPEGMCTDLRKFIEGPSHFLTLPPDLKSAVRAVCFIAEQLQAAKDYEVLKEDWQYVAMVVDRLFLCTFVIFTSVGTLAIFTDASFNVVPNDPFMGL